MKLVAARSGPGRYGRNNICYVEGMGSFHGLEAFYINYPSGADDWQKIEMMDICSSCLLCMENCPTQVIPVEEEIVQFAYVEFESSHASVTGLLKFVENFLKPFNDAANI